MVFVLLRLASVLVPLVFAVFLAFLVEPLLQFIVFAPQAAARPCAKWFKGAAPGVGTLSDPATLGIVVSGGRSLARRPGGADEEAAGEAAMGHAVLTEDDALDEGSGAILSGDSHAEGASSSMLPPESCFASFRQRIQMLWDVVSILICVVLLLGLGCVVVLGFYASLNSVEWKTYEESPKLEEFKTLMRKVGINETNWQDAMQRYSGELTSFATTMLGIVGDVVITMLLFFFCLFAMLPGIHSRAPRSRMRRLMQRYLLCKTLTSLIIALAVMVSLWAMDVNLVIIFGMLTFLFNFIPNIGSFFAIVAPAPLVYLTPGRTLDDVVMVLLVPFLIHNTLGCILEPQMMQAGLDLHPLTVVVALTFWGSVWGISGMVLSVPITCAVRLLLEEADHPHARLLHTLLDHPLGVRRKRTSPLSTPDSSVSGRDVAD